MGYLERLETYRDEMIRTLGESVSYPSVNADAVRTKDGEVLPFGRGVQDALVHMLAKGESLGFEAHNVDNYAGYVELKADDKYADSAKEFAIVGHLDVMPEGTGWDGDPFVMTEKDGYLYGRGTSDDKGPVVASMYALKALKEEGAVFKSNVRVVFGLDEETGSTSINYYTEHCGHPDMGFTPDGEFPVVNGEMGILVFDLAQKLSTGFATDDLRLTKLQSGERHNAVPADAKAVIAGDKKYFDAIADLAAAYARETGYTVRTKKQGASLVVETKGVAAHGAHPQLGLNAISIMMDFLGRVSFANEELNDFIRFYNDHIGFDLHGDRIGCKFEDNPSGPLIFNVGVANINEELATLTIGIRYPVTYTEDQVTGGIQSSLENTSIGLVIRAGQGPVFMDVDTPMVQDMLGAYRDETGDNESGAMVIGGGTYAKSVNNILCFGGMFPGEEDTMHQANEKFCIESFMKMARIYARAIAKLCCE
ncbi:MAG: dipeptidase PepV [Mogibacterium sp.]|nr:dipeptidase PepV [Mogibacterium sp.]MBR2540753.1 dipeptidase PepV [Mogibacterium sp.]